MLSSTSPDNMYLQMSVSATATDLGNRTKYPNVYMVIPDDSKQIKVNATVYFTFFLLANLQRYFRYVCKVPPASYFFSVFY